MPPVPPVATLGTSGIAGGNAANVTGSDQNVGAASALQAELGVGALLRCLLMSKMSYARIILLLLGIAAYLISIRVIDRQNQAP